MKSLLIMILGLVLLTTNGFCEDNSLIVGESGNVGIGTTNPQIGKLEVVKTAPGQEASLLSLRNMSSDANTAASLSFTTYHTSETARISAVDEITGNARTRLEFRTHNNANLNPRMIIDPDGNVGIGTTTPQIGKLEVVKTVPGQEASLLSLRNMSSNANTAASLSFTTYHTSETARISAVNEVTGGARTRLEFRTHNNANLDPRMIIDPDGNVGIGKENPSYKLDINGAIRGTNISPSDARFKTNITTLENALEKVTNLRGVTYEWTEPSKGVGDQIGVIAQEVEEVFPEVVSTDNDGYKSVAYAKLVGPIIEAVKTLDKENQKLTSICEQLAKENEGIKNELLELKQVIKNLQ